MTWRSRLARPPLPELTVFLAALAVFALGASARGLWRNDEHRYAEVARVMAVDGGSWLVPHLNGVVYTAKPPLFFWTVAGAHRLGLDLEPAAMLPSVLGGALAVLAIFALGRRLYGLAAGLAAAIVLASSEMFLGLALRANLDALLVACTTGALYAYWRGEESPAAAGRFALLAGVLTGLGILVKGPVAVGVVAVVIAGHRVLDRGREGRRWQPLLAGLAVAALVPLAWLGAAGWSGGLDYVREIALGHGVGHAAGRVDKQGPFWFYLKDTPAAFLPWTLLLPAGLWSLRRVRSSGDAFVLAWCVAPFLLLSLMPPKRHLYMTPAFPGFALVVARLLGGLLEEGVARDRVERRLWQAGRVALGAVAVAAGVLAAGLAGVWIGGWEEALPVRFRAWAILAAGLAVPRWLVLPVGGALFLTGVGMLRRRDPALQARFALGVGVATSLLLAGVFHPVESAGHRSRAFFEELAERVGDAPLVAYGRFVFDINWGTGRTSIPMLVNTKKLARYTARAEEPFWLVAEGDELEELGEPPGGRVVMHGPRGLNSDLFAFLVTPRQRDGRAGDSHGPRIAAETPPR